MGDRVRTFSQIRTKLYQLTRYSFAVPISKRLKGVAHFLEADDYVIKICGRAEIEEMLKEGIIGYEDHVLMVIPIYNNKNEIGGEEQ